MGDTVFCLDISDDKVTGVLVDVGQKVTVVVGCGQEEIAEQSLEDAVAGVCESSGFLRGECRLSLNMELFSFRNLSVPFSDRKKITQILPMELENLSANESEDSVTDFIFSKTGTEGAQIVTATMEKSSLAIILQVLKKREFDPVKIEIRGIRSALNLADHCTDDCILLDIQGSRVGLIIVTGGRVALCRSLRFGAASDSFGRNPETIDSLVKKTLLACRIIDLDKRNFTFYLTGDNYDQEQVVRQLSSQFDVKAQLYQLTGQPLVKVAFETYGAYYPRKMDMAFALALKINAEKRSFNFCKGEFRKRRSTSEVRAIFVKVSVLVLLAVASISLYLGYDYKNMRNELENLNGQIVQVFTGAMPKVKRIVNPLQQLQVKINEIRKAYKGSEEGGGHTVLSLLTEISARIPQSYPVTLKRMVADVETVRLKGIAGGFDTVDNMRKELGKSHFFRAVTISSATQIAEGDEVRFELKLELL